MEIRSLGKGDEVVILPYIGYPDSEATRIAIIADVDSKEGIAITTDGISLRDDMGDGVGVTRTGKVFTNLTLDRRAIELITVRRGS